MKMPARWGCNRGIWWQRTRVYILHTEIRIQIMPMDILLTCFVFDKLAHLFCMMYVAVINNENTAWTRIRISEWNLQHGWVRVEVKLKPKLHTTSFSQKHTNFSDVTEPSMMSYVIIPSMVRIGGWSISSHEQSISSGHNVFWQETTPVSLLVSDCP